MITPDLEECPTCHTRHLVIVLDADDAKSVCETCGECWRVEGAHVTRVDALTCSDCPRHEQCLARLAGGPPPHSEGLPTDQRRAERLAAGLRGIGVSSGSALSILVCDYHAQDRAVATIAAQLLGAVVTHYDRDQPIEALAECLQLHRDAVLFACIDGVDIWRETKVPLRVVGEGPGVLWWRALDGT